MTGTNHGMTGAVIALLIRDTAIAVPLSFLSHFVCDAIPHFGLKPGDKLFGKIFNRILIADFFVAITMMFLIGALYPQERVRIWACMAAAASPDLMWAYYHLYVEKIKARKPKLDLVARFHAWIQWSQTPKGWFVEIAWFLAMGSLILIGR